MKFPSMPRKGYPVEDTVRDILNWLRAAKIINVAGGRVKETPNGTTIEISKTTQRTQKEYVHPWKVTANGDDSVTVAKGKILSWSNQSAPPTDTIPIYYHLKEFKNYAGGIVESINANGVIYGSIPFIQAEVLYEADSGAGSLLLSQRIVPDVSATLSVAFATELPVTGNVFIFEIAKVTFADGVATVSDQVLEHNPQMWAFDLQIIPPA
jgi:hypothetical protein